MKNRQLTVLCFTVISLAGNVLYAQNISKGASFKLKQFKPIDVSTQDVYKIGYTDGLVISAAPGKPYISWPQTVEAVEKLTPQDTYALPWEMIWWSNILWETRVWRTIDAADTRNAAFQDGSVVPRANNLTAILVSGALNGELTAYSAIDDRFTTKLAAADLIKLMTTNTRTGQPGFNPDKISKYRIKEDWLFLDTQRIVVARILGIGPVRDVINPDGTTTEEPIFWVYYPDTRKYLAQHTPYEQKENWDQLFEGRHFHGVIDEAKLAENIKKQIAWEQHRMNMILNNPEEYLQWRLKYHKKI
jgi:hypothetical protein